MKNICRIVCIFIIFLTSCEMKNKPRPEQPLTPSSSKILILSEGLYNMNNSTLTYADLATNIFDYNVFNTLNHRGLGDTANDMKRYGNKIYIVVDISSVIEVIDAHTLLSVAQISLHNASGTARQPRHIVFHNSSAYVSCFDGSVVEIDTTSLQVTRTATAGRNPDHLTVAGNKLYVSNSGGLDYPYYDATVSVIDITSMTEISQIPVGINPGCIATSEQGDVYVVSRGDYGLNDYSLHKIDTEIDTVIRSFYDINPLNFDISGNTIYMYNYNYSTSKYWVKTFDCLTDHILQENIIDPSVTFTTPYSIHYDASSGELFITDARSYVLFGDLYCFLPDGTLNYKLSEIGLNPSSIIFLDN